jgi:selenocysteine-specific elongation factor
MRVIGTAGHVDHGKSTLVQALTGIHPDRLKEEQEREMTIDLGFAWMSLPARGSAEGEEVGIIDVPGHRDFIENMLAGIGGIDAALFVVAADEGVMPQTREHLAILDLLQIQAGVVALTKIDLVQEPDWLDLVEADLHEVLARTVLAEAPILRVSAKTGAGILEIKAALSDCLAHQPLRPDLNRPRLPVDRVFTIAGFGTVVTGTLTDGRLQMGDEVVILPRNLRGRVRGLQTHKRKEQTAVPGSRTAINISGVSLEYVQRGDVIAHPGDYRATQRLDASFRLLADARGPLKHNTEVKLFIGAAELVARVRLLGAEEIAPGQQGWLQLELSQPVVAVRGDHYILRRPSPGETLGGGIVVEPFPKGRHKRFSAATVQALQALSQGTPADVLFQALLAVGAAPLKEVVARSNLDADVAAQAVQELLQAGHLVNLEERALAAAAVPAPDDLITNQGLWNQIAQRMLDEARAYHKAYPLRRGIPREELKSRLKDLTKASPRLFNSALRKLVAEGTLNEAGPLVFEPGHTIRFTPQQQASIDGLLRRFAANPYGPPPLKECQTEVGEDVVNALVELEQMVIIPPDLVFRSEDYRKIVSELKELMRRQGTITVAQARDHFNTSRRYALALLEHLDATGVTVRQGDERRLR